MLQGITNNRRNSMGVVIVAALIVIIAGVGFFLIQKDLSGPRSALPPPAPNGTTTPQIKVIPPGDTSQGRTAPPYQGEPVATLTADPVALKQIPEDIYAKSKSELGDLARELAKNPRQPDLWMRVAYIKRFYNDYIGARDAYEYINRISESDPLPFYNLGLLYGYYLHEPAKAKEKLDAALLRDPENVSYRIGISDFYREVMHDNATAGKILLDGLVKVPGETDLLIALGAFYRATGDIPQAITYYEKALAKNDMAPAEKASLAKEVDRLKQQIGQP